ncbi:C1D nuclear receptor corepressor [Phyllostomus discolor]|uniref:Nuclear nucleic acid-binding protein C1D n=2 Tax=Phyllostomus discolor TaxID=89673 RepID=A0A834A0M7_9CHIR|nr:C1D nuclear receptor corepressor [Phyllostomus discolor]
MASPKPYPTPPCPTLPIHLISAQMIFFVSPDEKSPQRKIFCCCGRCENKTKQNKTAESLKSTKIKEFRNCSEQREKVLLQIESILKLVIMAEEEINEDYPAEIHEYLSTFENSIGAVDDMLKTMMSVSRNELLQKLDPLEQAKVDLVSAYTLNSMFWVYLATQGVNPKEHPVKQELERIRVYMNRVKEITDKKKAAKLDRGAASRFVKNALWEPKPKNASKVANKGKSKK